jgi:uncharacterized protein YpmB
MTKNVRATILGDFFSKTQRVTLGTELEKPIYKISHQENEIQTKKLRSRDPG